MFKLNPEITEFKTIFGLWWGTLWRLWAVGIAFYIVLGLIAFAAQMLV